MTFSLFSQTQAMAAGLALVIYLSTAFIPLLIIGRVALIARSPLHGHLARQLLRLQGVLALVPALSAVSLLSFGSGVEISLPEAQAFQAKLAAGLVGVGAALSWILPLCWANLKKKPMLLLLLTFILSSCFWVAVRPILNLVESGWLLHGGLAPLLRSFTEFSLPLINTTFQFRMDTVLAALFWLLGPAVAGCFALLWLLARRWRDDFGRDYYIYASQVCSSFAAAGGLLAIMSFTTCSKLLIAMLPAVEAVAPVALPVWLASCLAPIGSFLQGLLGAQTAASFGLATLSPALAMINLLPPVLAACVALLLFTVARNPQPMRCKISMILAPLLLLLAVAIACALLGLVHGQGVAPLP